MNRICKILLLTLSAVLLSAANGQAQEHPDDLAPGLEACIENLNELVDGSPDNGYALVDIQAMRIECYQAARQYWEEQIIANMRPIENMCAQYRDDPFMEGCESLKKAAKLGKQYRDEMWGAMRASFGPINMIVCPDGWRYIIDDARRQAQAMKVRYEEE